jgi:hypothetical protein
MVRRFFALVSLLALGCSVLLPAPRTAWGQPGAPPALGEVILEDPLTAPGVFRTGVSPSGRISGEFTPEGYRVRVTGPWQEGGAGANTSNNLWGVTFADGELRLEARVVTGQDRAILGFAYRVQSALTSSFQAKVAPGRDGAEIQKWVDGKVSRVGARGALSGKFLAESWNSLAARAKGAEFWLMLNDEVVAAGTDWTFGEGRTQILSIRDGDVNSDQESSVVYRNLRVSALAEGHPSRMPT